ncbi:rnhA [Mytilus coruscus]|uniref:ribonuclease H n=1 Tax=Mytilus coruscus TaxID=42192 RepID=A0A6J8BA53_MYTCO|nr:rnhA [Mytilus coruscus]
MDVYIDGACQNNGKPSAKASFGIFWEKNSTRNSSGLVPDTYNQTNNTGELFAAVKCLQQVHQLNLVDVNIKTDSEYLVRGVSSDSTYWKNNNWKLKSSGKDVKNKELWSEIDNMSTNLNVSWVHVPRDSESGQIEADKLAKNALNIRTSSTNNMQSQQQITMHTFDESECSDNEDETIPMKLVTPRRSTINQKAKKISNKTSSRSFGVISALRRIEGLLLSTAEDVSNLNDTVNCHIDSTNKQFQEINDKFVSLANTVKVQTSSASTSVEEVLAQTHVIKTDINSNNKTFVDKSKSLWDKVNAVFQEVKSIKTSNENIAMQDKVAQINTSTPNSK